jgi:formylglycine-generating enzyme required for sulfatase activity
VIPKKIDVPKPVELPPAMKPADQRPRIRQIAPKTKVNGATPPDATLSDKSAPPPAIAPFDAATALKHQEAWAKHLGMPVRTTNSIAMKLVLIPPGEFTMGSSDSGKPARRNEKAEHRVRITKPFYLGSRAVTHAEYKQVVGYDPSSFRGDPNQPIDVNWEQAISFCRELSDLKGEEAADERYRLPTEAEWEYCCRAGMTTASGYSFDDDLADPRRHSRFSSKQRKGPSGGHQAIGPQPPWQLRPNAWGLHDMHGNVVEWCNDWFEDEPSAGVSGILVGFRVARTLVPSTSGSARSSPRSGTKASELSVPKGETTPSPSAGTVPK